MHGDEANQAVRTGTLLEGGGYRYDPNDHHGPVLYYAALPFCRATSKTFAATTERNYRLVPVAFFALTLLLISALGRSAESGIFPGETSIVVALFLMALSPAMAYYSRFFIQETLLITFQTGLLFCAVRYACVCASGRVEDDCTRGCWALAFGAFAGLAIATKETFVLTCAAGVVALLLSCGWQRLRDCWSTRDLLLAITAAVVVALLFFSSFFTHPRGIYDALFTTVQAYLTRATAVPEHQHPWNFYLKIIFWFKYGRGPLWSEATLLVPALVTAVASFWPRRGRPATAVRLWRFLTLYTIALTVIYSAIPYKTPWCALSFLHGYILLAAIGVGLVLQGAGKLPDRLIGRLAQGVVVTLVVVVAWHNWLQLKRACFEMPADPRNPFVYAHTGADALSMVAAIDKAARAAHGYNTPIAFAVPTPDTWPLPWYLRKYKQVGYWTEVAAIPAGFNPTILIVAADQGDQADARFGQNKQANFYGVRPGVLVNLFLPRATSPKP